MEGAGRRVLERRVVEAGGVGALVPAWLDLAARAARSPFESPAWLLPWLQHYAARSRHAIVTWWRENDLVGAAPVVWRRNRVHGIGVHELEFWGRTDTPLGGWVDILVEDADAELVGTDFAEWLARSSGRWSLFHYFRLSPGAPLLLGLDGLPRRWPRVDLTRVLHSVEYDLELPADPAGWPGPLGPKARHEVRRQRRRFERSGGRVERVSDPDKAGEIVIALRSLLAESWGDREAYFRRDPSFRPFLTDAIRSALAAGQGWALMARDGRRVVACLVILAVREHAVAILTGVTREPEYRSMSLGKCLFHQAITDAASLRCRRFSFLTEDGYKRAFWHAEGRPIESGFLARGGSGWLIAATVGARRIAPERIRGRVRGRTGDTHRP